MNSYFSGISFIWAIIGMAFLLALCGLWSWFSHKRLAKEAKTDWAYRVDNNMQDLRLNEAAFVRAYKKVNGPRLSTHFALGAGLILILTPIAFALINVALWGVWKLNDESRVFEPGYLVWQFSIFFSLIAVWALIGAAVARRYHGKAPGLMRDELMIERGGFVPDRPMIVGANPAHILSNPDQSKHYQKWFSEILLMEHHHDKNWNGTGHACDEYRHPQEDAVICVHTPLDDKIMDETTHPFFFVKAHAREGVEQTPYTIIIKSKYMAEGFEEILSLGIEADSVTGKPHSRMRSLSHQNIEFYWYGPNADL